MLPMLHQYLLPPSPREQLTYFCQRICHSTNGWTDGELGLVWMTKDFDPQMKEKAAGATRVLLMDGHSSHYTYELLAYARENNIIILGYSPHCTHVLQGLDVVCFAKMKTEFYHKIHIFEDSNKHAMTKGDFTGVFGRAFLRAFTKDAIEAAFCATEIFPFDPNVIHKEAMKPSLPTLTKASFPLLQASPVRTIMAAMGAQPPTAFDIEADASHTPGTPLSLCHARDPFTDPELHTPSKRLRFMYSGLSATESGSCLVAKTRITSNTKIPPPVFEGLPPELPKVDWSILDNPASSTLHQTRESLIEQVEILTENLCHAQTIICTYEAIEEG
jgi:DDE superfamily endonuclease